MGEIVIDPKFNVNEKYNEVIFLNPYRFGSNLNPAAQTFIDIALITDSTQISAINQLISDLQTANLWNKLKAIYPFVGGTAHSHKFNLKDPRDLNEAFRLTYYNTNFQHDANGVLNLNTANAMFMNTNLIPFNVLPNNSTHLSIYSRTNLMSTSSDIGCDEGTSNRMFIDIKFTNSLFYTDFYNATSGRLTTNIGTNPSTGLFIGNRESSTNLNSWQNGIKLATLTTLNSTTLPSVKTIRISGLGTQYQTQRQYAFASIGEGFTDSEALAYYNIVQAYQTTLGRQV